MKRPIALLSLLLITGCSAPNRLAASERECTYNGTVHEVNSTALAYLQAEQFGITIETEPGTASGDGSIVTPTKETDVLRTKVTAAIKPHRHTSAKVSLYISAEKKGANDVWGRVDSSQLRQICTMYLDDINMQLRG